MGHDPCQNCTIGDNVNTEQDKGADIYEESDQDPEDAIDDEVEEEPEEEIHEESDELQEYVVEEEFEEDPEEEITQEHDEEEQRVEKSHLSSVAEEHDGENGLPEVTVTDECASKQQEHGGSSRKHRLSRWDHKREGEASETDGKSKRRKTRWDNNDTQNGILNPFGFSNPSELLTDPEIISLRVKLMEINKKLQSSEIHDERLAAERSPSPEPVYNNLGIRINTRDSRIRKKLMNARKQIVSKIAAKTRMTFESPAEPKPVKLVKKLFIPEKEYPTYNFVGLILGPKGNTQKKMEKETGARIYLRGRGCGEPDQSEDEDLHVRVEADNQQALDAAMLMIEKLLIPVEDQNNVHKRAQLAELAKLRGTHKDNNVCDLCKEKGHRKYACPLQDSTFKAVCCDICGSFVHSTSNCTVSLSHQICMTLQGSSGVASSTKDKSNKEVDLANLYVGYLPQAIDEKWLKELFSPFGKVIKTTVIKDQATGSSKGYGFIKFENPSDAAAAMTYMNGYKMDGKMLAVRVAGKKPIPGALNSGHVPVPPSHTAVPSNILGQPFGSDWPALSMLPEAPFITMNKESLPFPSSSSYSGYNVNASRTEALNIPPYVVSSISDPRATSHFSLGYDFCDKIPTSLPGSVSQLPGYPDYTGSQFKSYFTSSTANETPSQMAETDKRSSFWSGSCFL